MYYIIYLNFALQSKVHGLCGELFAHARVFILNLLITFAHVSFAYDPHISLLNCCFTALDFCLKSALKKLKISNIISIHQVVAELYVNHDAPGSYNCSSGVCSKTFTW